MRKGPPGRAPNRGVNGCRLHSRADLSESPGRGQLPPVFALAAGLPGAAFESEISHTTKGGRATRYLLLQQPARSPS